MVHFLSALGDFDKLDVEAFFIGWLVWFSGNSDIGFGDYRMFSVSWYLRVTLEMISYHSNQ